MIQKEQKLLHPSCIFMKARHFSISLPNKGISSKVDSSITLRTMEICSSVDGMFSTNSTILFRFAVPMTRLTPSIAEITSGANWA